MLSYQPTSTSILFSNPPLYTENFFPPFLKFTPSPRELTMEREREKKEVEPKRSNEKSRGLLFSFLHHRFIQIWWSVIKPCAFVVPDDGPSTTHNVRRMNKIHREDEIISPTTTTTFRPIEKSSARGGAKFKCFKHSRLQVVFYRDLKETKDKLLKSLSLFCLIYKLCC